jgi:predicted nucleotidyltransferase
MTTEEWASESKLAEALSEVVLKCQELQIDLLLIGAFAVRAHAVRRRLTTDLDFVAPRSAQSGLAALFKSLGYDYSAHTRFGGVRAIKYASGRKIQLDVAIDAIRDENSGNVYVIPEESFRQRLRVRVVPLEGGTGVEAYAIPLTDLLILKLMAGREQDAADAVALILSDAFPNVIPDFKRKARDAGLMVRINTRLGELLSLTDKEIQSLMSGHTGGRLSVPEVSLVRRRLRELRI